MNITSLVNAPHQCNSKEQAVHLVQHSPKHSINHPIINHISHYRRPSKFITSWGLLQLNRIIWHCGWSIVQMSRVNWPFWDGFNFLCLVLLKTYGGWAGDLVIVSWWCHRPVWKKLAVCWDRCTGLARLIGGTLLICLSISIYICNAKRDMSWQQRGELL